VNTEHSVEKREEVYTRNRKVLHHQIRNSSKCARRVCRGFFAHPDHIARHFSWLTGAEDLSATVDKNLHSQIGYLLQYLQHIDKTMDFKEKIAEIDELVETEYDGCRVFKDIQILRIAGSHFDFDGTSLVRLERELPSPSASPFILAVESNRLWVFEVWGDGEKLLGNLSLSTAIAAFLHVSFVFNMKYPKGAQTLADIFQRRFAKYGDDSGTKTTSSKQTAQSKMTKYMVTLGSILSDM